jgi:hypothetical protein
LERETKDLVFSEKKPKTRLFLAFTYFKKNIAKIIQLKKLIK